MEEIKGFKLTDGRIIENKDEAYIVEKSALEFFELYFPSEGKKLLEDKNYEIAKKITGFSNNVDAIDRSKAIIDWITDLVKVGWHLCSNT
jgi:CRISPR-associated protein Cmr2